MQAQTGESEFEVFKLKGLAPVGIHSSIRDGCVRIMDAIADPDLPLLVSRSLTWVMEALGAVSPDRKRPDVYDESSTYSHVLDACGTSSSTSRSAREPGSRPTGTTMPGPKTMF